MATTSSSLSHQPFGLHRRRFLATAGSLALGLPSLVMADQKRPKYRAAVIGHTGRGDYGHGLDEVWLGVPDVKLVGVADANAKGLGTAVKRLRLEDSQAYGDYRRMLRELKPDLVSICPRWVDQHHDMVVAAAEQGVKGIYLEKPLCRTLKEADQMVAACKAHGVKVAVSHQTRYSPKLPVIEEILRKGGIGKLLEIRGRGKEDRRVGGEDLWVLGTHVMDMMHCLGGKPRWCFASVEQNGRPIRKEDVVPGKEGIELLAGDSVHARYRLGDGVVGYFDSTRNGLTKRVKVAGRYHRYGIRLIGSEGVVEMGMGYLGASFLLRDPLWSSGRTQKKWIPISSAGVGVDEPLVDTGLKGGNDLAVRDLIAAMEADRDPKSSIEDARLATEMIVAAFESQRMGGPVVFPLKNRGNPLSMLAARE